MIQVLIPTLRQPCFTLISPPAPDILLRIATATTVLTLLAAAIAACSPLGILNSLTPTAAYKASVDVAYGPEPNPE